MPVGKVGERRGFVACGGAVVLVWAGRRLKEEPQRGGESLTDTGGFAAGLRVETWDFSPTEREGSTRVNRSGVEAKRRREGTAARAALKRAD